MKTVPKLILVLILSFLVVSCGKNIVTTPLATTIPPTATVPQPTPITSTPPTTSSPSPTTPPASTLSPTPIMTPSTITFDFDTGSPTPSVGQNTPFDQTSGGVTANFSSPSDPATFSVQNHDTTFLTLSQFSGNYLYPNSQFRKSLTIKFRQLLTSVTLTFATIEYHGVGEVEEPSTIKLSAYVNSTGTTPVGTASARGSLLSNSFPQGMVTFNSGGQPFNLLVIELLPQARGGTAFLVDSITVTAAS